MKVELIQIRDLVALPRKATERSSGIDISFVDIGYSSRLSGIALEKLNTNITKHDMPISVQPMERLLLRTGLHCKIPKGYEIQIRPRSGNAMKKGLTVLNSPGTIDEDFENKEIGVLIINFSKATSNIKPGDYIAQLVLVKTESDFKFRDSRIKKMKSIPIEAIAKRKGGFGSTDVVKEVE